MKVDDIKVALKRSDGAHRSVVRALEDDRMVIFKGSLLLVEQEGGETAVYLLRRYTVDPGDLYMYRFEKA